MSLGLTDDKSTLVQVMAWCRQATSHYLSLHWPRSVSLYGIIRPQWVHVILKSVLDKSIHMGTKGWGREFSKDLWIYIDFKIYKDLQIYRDLLI